VDILVHIIGWCGALTSSLLALPQAIKLYRNPFEQSGVSLLTWLVVVMNASLWLLYALLTKAYPVGVPSLINGPLAIYIIYKILRTTDKPSNEEQELVS
jgi:uncharacterized protein with PQ loop repeat